MVFHYSVYEKKLLENDMESQLSDLANHPSLDTYKEFEAK